LHRGCIIQDFGVQTSRKRKAGASNGLSLGGFPDIVLELRNQRAFKIVSEQGRGRLVPEKRQAVNRNAGTRPSVSV